MISSSVQDHNASFEELVTELVDAHVDTIQLLGGCDDATTDAAHLDYLQALVRYSKRLMAQASSQGAGRAR
jgi:hypothetical protein